MTTRHPVALMIAVLLAGCNQQSSRSVAEETPAKPRAVTLSIEVDLETDQALFTIWNGTDEFVMLENRELKHEVYFEGPDGRQSATRDPNVLREMPTSFESLLIIPAGAQITYPVPFSEGTRGMRKPGMEFYAEIQAGTTGFWTPELAKAAKGYEKHLLKTQLVSPKVVAQ